MYNDYPWDPKIVVSFLNSGCCSEVEYVLMFKMGPEKGRHGQVVIVNGGR